MTTTFLPTVLFLLLLNNLLLLGAPRLPALIRLTAFQGILLAALLLCLDHALLAGAVLLIKGLLLPGLLTRTRKRLRAGAGLRPRLHIGLGILAGMSGLVFSLWLEARLSILPGLFPPLLLPTALTTLFCGADPGRGEDHGPFAGHRLSGGGKRHFSAGRAADDRGRGLVRTGPVAGHFCGGFRHGHRHQSHRQNL